MANAGNRVVFEPDGGYIENLSTGKRTQLSKEGAAYKLKMWVKARNAEDELHKEEEYVASVEGLHPFSWQGIP